MVLQSLMIPFLPQPFLFPLFFLQSTPRHSRCLQHAWLMELNTVLASNVLLGLICPQPLLPVFQCRMSALLCSSQSFIFTGQFETCPFVNNSTMKSSILKLPVLDANTVGVWWVLLSARYQLMTCEASLSKATHSQIFVFCTVVHQGLPLLFLSVLEPVCAALWRE